MVSCNEIKIQRVPIIQDNNETVTFIEQYVKQVCDFSSQYGSSNSISYTAYNIAGNPSKFPDYGDYPQAFVMVCTLFVPSSSINQSINHYCIIISRELMENGGTKHHRDLLILCHKIMSLLIVKTI